jgi:hypothetical protein
MASIFRSTHNYRIHIFATKNVYISTEPVSLFGVIISTFIIYQVRGINKLITLKCVLITLILVAIRENA